MKRLAGGLAVAITLAGGAARADYLARNGMIATASPVRAGYVEVFQKALAGPSDYWCTAGAFVRYAAHQHNTTRIYVVRGLGPSPARPGRSSVIFSYVKYDDIPDLSEGQQGYSVSASKPGYTLSAGHGTAFCDDSVRRFRRFGFGFVR